jgi:hypothetical protein
MPERAKLFGSVPMKAFPEPAMPKPKRYHTTQPTHASSPFLSRMFFTLISLMLPAASIAKPHWFMEQRSTRAGARG